jgi:uncharacterized protein YkuJ
MTQFYQTPCNDNEILDPEFDDYSLGAELTDNGDFISTSLNQWNSGATPLSTTLGVLVNGWTGANPTRVEHISGYTDSLNQTSLGFVVGEAYQITIEFTRTSGSIEVVLGDGVEETKSGALEVGGTYTFNLMYLDNFNDIVQVRPTTDFVGYVNSISVKQINYDYWVANGSWTFDNGFACHIEGTIGDLVDTAPNYIDAGGYYVASITVSSYVQGSINLFVSDILVGIIFANGTYTYYAFPSLNGTMKVEASSDFIGCISLPSVYELRDDYTAFIIDENGNQYDVSNYIEYYEQYVTLKFDFATVGNYELPSGCYSVKMYDQCIIQSDNLVWNGDFVDGFTDWYKNNGNAPYSITGDELTITFDPFSYGSTNFITNGDFSSGTTGWTFGTGWSLVSGKARHTPGNTATLSQTLTLPTPPLPAVGYNYFVKFTISNHTIGTVNIGLGTGSKVYGGNDDFIIFLPSGASGNVNLTITPSSNFDGDIDDFGVIIVNLSSSILLNNKIQPLITPGTYQVEWDIISSTLSNIRTRAVLVAAQGNVPLQNTAGSYSYTQTYTQNGSYVQILADFTKTNSFSSNVYGTKGSITVDNISLKKIEPFEATYETECLSYNENGWDKTKMIVAWCDQPSFGFEFANTGFKLQQRALIRSINPTYPNQKNIQQMGSGNARMVYAEIEKYWELHTDFASETFHDAMAVQLSCDHLQIGDTQGNGKEYITNGDEYIPSWQGDGTYSLATATFEVRIKEKGQIFNRHI